MADDSEEYSVEAIRGWRYNDEKQQKEFLIKWQGYAESENTWEPEEHLTCPEILEAFAKSLSGKQKKYFYVSRPDKLTGFQRNADFVECVGADGPHDSDDEDAHSQKRAGRQKFYCLIAFADSRLAEEVTLKEFFEYQPEKALKFCEQRLIYRES